MASPTCTAYRWPEDGGSSWLVVLPTGQYVTGWCTSERFANTMIGGLSRSAGCPTTVLHQKHPNEVNSEVFDA